MDEEQRVERSQQIDKSIIDTSAAICNNIAVLNKSQRGLLSQNILSQLRNLVEYVAIKIAFHAGEDVNPMDYKSIKGALNYVRKRDDLDFLNDFHKLLQKSVSHYTMDPDGSERLMLKYFEYIIKVKDFLKTTYGLTILENILDFPLNTDAEQREYYKKIAERIDHAHPPAETALSQDRYYVQKIKPFLVNRTLYYEVTFTSVFLNTLKFERLIAFTRHKFMDNYAVKFALHRDEINVLGRNLPIFIIDRCEVSIRPCELTNFARILGVRIKCSSKSPEYTALMRFLSSEQMSLTELLSEEQSYYERVRGDIVPQGQQDGIFATFDRCREIILHHLPGANVLRYLLYTMNNRIIKQQWPRKEDPGACAPLSNLYLSYGCIPFDRMPYCTSLRDHNPRIYNLFEAIPPEGHEHEFLARHITNNTEREGELFTAKNKLKRFKDLGTLVHKYNKNLYAGHSGRTLKDYRGKLYLEQYVRDCLEIIIRLRTLASSGVPGYTDSVNSWLGSTSHPIDDATKKEALLHMFEHSHVALIYGSAGTGKSTLLNHIANFKAEQKKLFLANTHPAVENMRRKIKAENCHFFTIAKFLSESYVHPQYEILFIDECSTVSNQNMQKVLATAKFKLLVLAGDTHQIEAISFGNWFDIAQHLLPEGTCFTLTHPYRTNRDELLLIWDRVRTCDIAILEPLVKYECVSKLNETIFEPSEPNEIILCLNYDGLYGVNNINRFLQSNNPGKSEQLGINIYKVGDPILFNDSEAFAPAIHNNTKGRIVDIHAEERHVRFDVELEKSINEVEAAASKLTLIGESPTKHSIVSFRVERYLDTDGDDPENNEAIVPFQIAYAVSIHKAQGLEYDSVKIVITNEVEERISLNIFYTAITRTRNKLKIYWSPETEQAIISRFKAKKTNRDVGFLKYLLSEQQKRSECVNSPQEFDDQYFSF